MRWLERLPHVLKRNIESAKMKDIAITKLEQRSAAYRFDMERDIPWDTMSSQGFYYSESLLEKLGFNLSLLSHNREVMDVCQWVMGLATAQTFVQLERDLIAFIGDHCTEMLLPKSVDLLAEDEQKHIVLFQRWCDKLRLDRVELIDAFDRAYRPPSVFSELVELTTETLTQQEIQWLFWLNTLFFEEYTIYFSQSLQQDTVHPGWFAAHRCHQREEVQHVLTDAAYLEHIPLSEAQKQRLAIVFAYHFKADFRRFFCLETWDKLQKELFPDLDILAHTSSLTALPILDDIRYHRAFRFTRKFAPNLVDELWTRDCPARQSVEVTGKPHHSDTLITRFQQIANNDSAQIVFHDYQEPNISLSYAQLYQKSEGMLAALQQDGLKAGDTVLLVLSNPAELVPLFWACMLGGIIPVPLSILSLINIKSADIKRLLHIQQQLQSHLMVVDDRMVEALSDVLREAQYNNICLTTVSTLNNQQTSKAQLHQGSSNDIAFVQFSSGSMGKPRGVSLSHANLLSVIDEMLSARGGSKQDVFVNWLPLTHDMGLIGYHLTPLIVGATQVLLKPQVFIKHPLEWIQCLHDFKATATGGTCSALARVVKQVTPEFIEKIDLSSLNSLVIGAEPVLQRVLDPLMSIFSEAGLRAEAICPAYGLAEASLAVTMSPAGKKFKAIPFLKRQLESSRAVVSIVPSDETVNLVSLGRPIDGTCLKITNAAGENLDEGFIGNIQVAGRGVMSGYFRDEAATQAVIHDGWLDTGDQGFLYQGCLFFVGRALETFSMAGRKFYANDVEAVAMELDLLCQSGAALVIDMMLDGDAPKLILLVALQTRVKDEIYSAFKQLRTHVRWRLGINLNDMVAVRRRDIPRTTSGKISRYQILNNYKNHQYSNPNFIRASDLSDWDHCQSDENQSLDIGSEIREIFWQNVTDAVHQVWAKVLGCPADEIGIDDDFLALGGDSLAAAEIMVRLEKASGRGLTLDLLIHGSTIHKMAEFIQQCDKSPNNVVDFGTEHKDFRDAKNNQLDNNVDHYKKNEQRGADLQPIAVVAMALRLPGANSPEAFWQMLISSQDAFQSVPEARARGAVWNEIKQGLSSRPYVGAFVSDVESFDPKLFGISEVEAKYIDPQQRLFLEVCAEALNQVEITNNQIGVFAASGDNEYALRYLGDEHLIEKPSLLGGLRNMVAARVAQVFGFTGPAMVIDTACSSSATAVHLACESLRNGECHLALAGGVQLNLTDQVYLFFDKAGLLSKDGRCRPFDQHATGLVPGEGAGVVLLKRLDQAMADEDIIIGVIRSSAINNDAAALTGSAPSTIGQQQVIEQAYQRAKIDISTIGYIEAHAAGTVIGDAIEVRSLSEVFGSDRERVPIGSVKSNIGHTLAAAGISSLIKVLLSLQHKMLPATLHCSQPAQRIGFDRTRFFPLRQATPWQIDDNGVCRAGINSFGLGGSNVHIIVEQAPKQTSPSNSMTQSLLPYQRKRYWIDVASKWEGRPACFKLVDDGERAIRDHRINGIATAPLSWLIDLIFEFNEQSTPALQELHRITVLRPFSLVEKEKRRITITSTQINEKQGWQLNSVSDMRQEQTLHLQYLLRARRQRVFKCIDLAAIRERCATHVGINKLYQRLKRCGFEIGPSMRAVSSIKLGDEELLARLEAPHGATRGWLVDPCLLDGASHVVAAFMFNQQAEAASLFVGFSIDALRVFAPIHETAMAYIRWRPAETKSNELIHYDILLLAEDGEVLLVVENFCAKRVVLAAVDDPVVNQVAEDLSNHALVAITKEEMDRQEKIEKHVTSNKKNSREINNRNQFVELVRHVFAKRLNLPPAAIALHQSFSELGIDSLMAVQIVQELENKLGVRLHSTLLFEVKNITSLEEIIWHQLSSGNV